MKEPGRRVRHDCRLTVRATNANCGGAGQVSPPGDDLTLDIMILATYTLHSIGRRAISMERGEIPMRAIAFARPGCRLYYAKGAPRRINLSYDSPKLTARPAPDFIT